MLDDTTSTQPAQDLVINDQATLDAAIAEETAKLGESQEVTPEEVVVEEKEAVNQPTENYQQRYSEVRKDYDRLVKELKDLKSSKQAEETKGKLQEMDYDQRLEYVVDRLNQYENQFSQLQDGLSEQFVTQSKAEDQAHLDSFLTSDSELKEFPELHGIFKMYAHSDQLVDAEKYGDTRWNQVKLEDIKATVIKPMLEKLAGKKITVREKPLRGQSTPTVDSGWTPEKVAALTPQQYEKHRIEIFKSMGMRDL